MWLKNTYFYLLSIIDLSYILINIYYYFYQYVLTIHKKIIRKEHMIGQISYFLKDSSFKIQYIVYQFHITKIILIFDSEVKHMFFHCHKNFQNISRHDIKVLLVLIMLPFIFTKLRTRFISF